MARKPKYLLALEEIEKKNHGLLTPRHVVADAENPLSPLHNYFEWDDSKAAHAHRLLQARQLITKVRVRVEENTHQQYFNATVSIGESKHQGYVNRDRVKNEDEIYAQVLRQAAQELIYWRKKYASIKELRGIVNEEELQNLLDSTLGDLLT